MFRVPGITSHNVTDSRSDLHFANGTRSGEWHMGLENALATQRDAFGRRELRSHEVGPAESSEFGRRPFRRPAQPRDQVAAARIASPTAWPASETNRTRCTCTPE